MECENIGHAALMQEWDEVLTRLGRGEDPNLIYGHYKRTPLHFAVLRGHEAVLSQLLSSGAHVNARDRFGDTPLHDAAREGHIALVRPLVDAGASPMAHNEAGKTPIDFALGEDEMEVLDLLHKLQARQDAERDLQKVVDPGWFSPVRASQVEAAIQMARERGVDASTIAAAEQKLGSPIKSIMVQLLIQSPTPACPVLSILYLGAPCIPAQSRPRPSSHFHRNPDAILVTAPNPPPFQLRLGLGFAVLCGIPLAIVISLWMSVHTSGPS
uniref:Uncharacterized protein n=1 Tax=Haptolina ericina TaxID=156174 RepID=A0A7S3BN33_9EUKA|mmetsp:Transcript_63743/g.142186  ORF Transcript_63743/g.142186 Transcript_63743/m.142186 type:complete len:270 (+) Transcript_63743:56-865(+)